MIPHDHLEAVTRALSETFGVSQFQEARLLSKGPNSNLAYRIVAGGSPYLLRINTRKGDPARQYACMQAAADAGLAPRVWYTRAEDRISITDFVPSKPFPLADALVRIPAALRALHALAPFPGVPPHINTTCMFLMHAGPALDGFIQTIRAARVLPTGELDEVFAWHARMSAAYPRDGQDLVSSHNDLFKPDNMLFDGQRLWLVDWEAAFLNDRYADLAVAANQVAADESEEGIFLGEYFGAPPDQRQVARFLLMQQLSHMFYALAFLLIGSAGQPIDWSEPVPEVRDFYRRVWSGDLDLTDSRTKVLYGKVHRKQFFENLAKARYQDALRIVADGPAVR